MVYIYANIEGILMGSMLPYIPYMDPMGYNEKKPKSEPWLVQEAWLDPWRPTYFHWRPVLIRGVQLTGPDDPDGMEVLRRTWDYT